MINMMTKKDNNVLVAYFSHSGNTRVIADQIRQIVGGDIFEIQSEHTYPDSYNAVVKQAKQELESGFKPKLKTKVENMAFVGYPNWWSTIPRPVFTFLSDYELSNKKIIPFCTHEGSALGRSVEDIRKLCTKSTVLSGLEVRGREVKNAQNKVSKWLRENKVI
jgi:flavodoxin